MLVCHLGMVLACLAVHGEMLCTEKLNNPDQVASVLGPDGGGMVVAQHMHLLQHKAMHLLHHSKTCWAQDLVSDVLPERIVWLHGPSQGGRFCSSTHCTL